MIRRSRIHTLVGTECCDNPRLVERQLLLLHSADDILCSGLLHLGALRCHIHCEEWNTRVDLVCHTSFLATLVQSEEDQIRMGLSRVERLNHLLLGLIEDILRDELAHFVILRIIQLTRRPGQRSEVVQKDEAGGRVLQGRGQERVVRTQEGQAVDG